MVKTEPSYTVGGDINQYSHCGGQYGGSHSWAYIWGKKKSLKRHMHPNVYSSIVYNSQDMVATEMSINKGMDKENVVHT